MFNSTCSETFTNLYGENSNIEYLLLYGRLKGFFDIIKG